MNRARRPARIVVLHGFRMNAAMMRDMMADVEDALARYEIEWVYPNAANGASGAPPEMISRRWPEGPYREHWNAMDRADGSVRYEGYERCREATLEMIADGPSIDILMGYSQGAAAAAALTAELARDGKPPWRAVVLLNSGLIPRDPELARHFEAGLIDHPSIHVFGGGNDRVRPFSAMMADAFTEEQRIILEHEEGHTPPRAEKSAETLNALAAALGRHLENPS